MNISNGYQDFIDSRSAQFDANILAVDILDTDQRYDTHLFNYPVGEEVGEAIQAVLHLVGLHRRR